MGIENVMSTEEMAKSIVVVMNHLLQRKESIVVGIDGRCAAGKTTLASKLKALCDCNVIHMDHFFLRTEQKTEKRLAQPGGNIDYERFREEIILPLKNKGTFSYGVYDCHCEKITEKITVNPKAITIIEGAYSFHPKFEHIYDLKIFVDILPQEQERRIQMRNGVQQAVLFKEKWIPMEEKYLDTFVIKEECDIVIEV